MSSYEKYFLLQIFFVNRRSVTSWKIRVINLIYGNYSKIDSLEWSRLIRNRAIIQNGSRVRKARAVKTVKRSLESMAWERPRDNEKCYGYCALRIQDMRYSRARILRNDIYGKTYIVLDIGELVSVNQQYIIHDEILQHCLWINNRISLSMRNKKK